MTTLDAEPAAQVPRRTFATALRRFDAGLARVEEVLAQTILVTLAFVVLFYVVARAFLTSFFSVSWALELGSLLLLWLVMLGASIAERENLHLRVDLLQSVLPGRIHRVLELFGAVLGAIFLAIIIWQAIPIISKDLRNSMLSLPLPLAVVQLAVLVGATLMLFHLIVRRFLHLTDRPSEPVKEDWL